MIQLGGKYCIKVCLDEMYSKVRIGKHLSDSFPIQNDLKQGDAYLHQIPGTRFC
jgi:hypothetical protein